MWFNDKNIVLWLLSSIIFWPNYNAQLIANNFCTMKPLVCVQNNWKINSNEKLNSNDKFRQQNQTITTEQTLWVYFIKYTLVFRQLKLTRNQICNSEVSKFCVGEILGFLVLEQYSFVKRVTKII